VSKETYPVGIAQVFSDEGGYTNESTDPGGPTNWGITLADARMHWKHDATAADVKNMPKAVAEMIYRKHYADPIKYDDLPAGVDYAVLDYGINSGISRSVKVLQGLVGAPVDGKVGPITLAKVKEADPTKLINAIYDERMAFLKKLHHWPTYGKGWTARCTRGRKLALELANKKPDLAGPITGGSVIVAGGAVVAAAEPTLWPWILGGTVAALLISFVVYKLIWKNKYVEQTKKQLPVDLGPTGKGLEPVEPVDRPFGSRG
jgi:lysozyme family protein